MIEDKDRKGTISMQSADIRHLKILAHYDEMGGQSHCASMFTLISRKGAQAIIRESGVGRRGFHIMVLGGGSDYVSGKGS